MSDPTRKCPRCGGSGEVRHDGLVGKLMRERRMKAGISLRELARRIKWSAAYVSSLELGQRMWTDSKLQRYAKGLKP